MLGDVVDAASPPATLMAFERIAKILHAACHTFLIPEAGILVCNGWEHASLSYFTLTGIAGPVVGCLFPSRCAPVRDIVCF
jgi:hypothetical protein